MLVAMLGACGGDGADTVALADLERLSAEVLPLSVLDLTVTTEEFSATIKEGDEPYIDGLGLFALRKGDLLQATLQVSRFGTKARIDDPLFRRQLAARVGDTSNPSVVRVGESAVYLVSGGRQTIAVWFAGNQMFVASVREEFEQPRSLVRALVEHTVPDGEGDFVDSLTGVTDGSADSDTESGGDQ